MAGASMRPIAEMDGRTKFVVMAGTLLGLFTAAMDQTVVATSIPHIVADLGGFGLFSWVGTGFLLASTTTIPIVGKLSDLFGRKPFFMGGIVVLLIGSALCGSAQNIEQLIAFRVVQGFGAGMIMSIAFTIVGDVFPPAERGRWMGLMTAAFTLASVAGPLIGGGLTDHVHWRWVFYMNIPLGLVALTVLGYGMPRIRPESSPKIDYAGLVLLCATTVPLLLAFSWAGDRYEWASPQIIGFLAWAGAALALLTFVELRAEEPLFPIHLFRNRTFAVSALVTAITGFAMMGSLFYIPLFVQGVLGASATASGLVTMPMMIGMTASSVISGQVMSRTGRYRILGVAGLMLMVAGMTLLSTLDSGSARRDVTMYMIVFGFGLGTAIPLFMLAVQNAVPYRVMGVATSSMQFLRSVGGVMGIAIVFSIIQSQYAQGVEENVPQVVQENPQTAEILSDPQFLVNEEALGEVEASFAEFGEQGEALFAETLTAVRVSLADGITEAFFIGVFVLLAAVVVGTFLKEEPLRKTHLEAGEDGTPIAVPVEAAEGSLPPLAGGSNGERET